MAHDERLDMTLSEAVYSLRAIRRQKPDPIPDQDIRAILDAPRLLEIAEAMIPGLSEPEEI